MRKRTLHILTIICLISATASAQDPRIRRAEQAMQSLQYQEAIRLYEEVLAKKPEQAVQLNLAEAYRKTQDYERSVAAYAKVEDWAQAAPEYLFQYGRVLIQARSCPEAQPVFDQFIERKPFDHRAADLRDVCGYLNRIRSHNEDLFKVTPAAFNTSFNEMAPAIYGEGLVFASNSQSLKNEFLDLFFAGDPAADAYTLPFAAELNTKLHEATASFSADQNRIFFTRSREMPATSLSLDSRIVPLEIMSATRQENDSWSKPEALNLADPAHSAAHPCISADGKRLFFSSDRPGGFGGKDIYYTDWTGSGWGPPVNLGPEINTEGDELYPFLHEDGRLFFSSDGHLGLGGFDIFCAESQAGDTWAKVFNMGAPFNSEEDDFALVFSPGGASGYFSSNRPGGAGGDDIYLFQQLFYLIQLAVQDAVSGESIAGAEVQSNCLAGDKVRIPADGCCNVSANAAGYDSATVQICGKDIAGKRLSPWPLKLEAEKIYSLSGNVSDESSGMPLAGAAIHLIDPSGQVALALVTDEDGRFSSQLPANSCYNFKVEKGDYFARTLDEKICTEGSSTLFVLDVLLQPFWISATQANRAMKEAAPGVFLTGKATGSDDKVPFLLQIYYDRYSADIREDALPEMEKLRRLLEDNSGIVIEISSHTDTRGDRSFNQRLSQKRADNVVKWLINNGVDRKRLVAKGYGKLRPVNHCVDGVTCPEAEHQLNRRTEFRVVGKVK